MAKSAKGETKPFWARPLARLATGDAPRALVVTSVCLLVSFGTVMVFSSAAFHWSAAGDTTFFLRKQVAWVVIASLAGLFFYQIDYRLLKRWYWQLLVLTTVLLAVVLLPQIGTDVNQSRRWLRLGGGLQFQPSELSKLAVIVFVAAFLANDPTRRHRFLGGFMAACLAVLPAFVLILIEPDFGTSVFVLGLALMLLVLGGVRLYYLVASAFFFLPMLALAAHSRWDQISHRILAFLHPAEVYQVRHSLTALGSGGWFGQGLGAGGQKLSFLPEAHTDFILAIVGEETGFVGCALILLFFVALVWGGVGIVWRARDDFGFLVGAGIILGLGVQAFLNVAVVTASAPTKGIALPFVTFGGSGLVMSLCQIGILLSIDRVWREEQALESVPRAGRAVASLKEGRA